MKDNLGIEITEKELIKKALCHLSDACSYLFETNSEAGNALAFMVDSSLKFGQVIYRGDDVLLASADYTKYEEGVCPIKHDSTLRVIK